MTQPAHIDLDALRAAAEARNLAGAQLANVAFNRSQQIGYALTSDDCEMLRKLYKQWDTSANVAPEIIDRLRKAEAAREGWKWVPVEPTTKMLDAGKESIAADVAGSCGEYVGTTWGTSRDAWESMLAAAPDSTPTDSADSEGAK